MKKNDQKEDLVLKTYKPEDLAALPMSTKLKMLHEGVVNTYLMHLQAGDIHPRDLAPMMTLLRNNDIKEEHKEEDSMHDKVLKALDSNEKK